MVFLLESPLSVAAIGLLAIVLVGVVYTQTRTNAALAGVVLAVLLTFGGVTFERLWLTPTEQVRMTVDELLASVKANDLPGVLAKIAPAATDVRSDAKTLMPMFNVESAGVGGEVRVEFDHPAEPTGATASLKPLIKVQHKKSGAAGAYFDSLELDFVWLQERWLLTAYRPAKDWREGASRLGR